MPTQQSSRAEVSNGLLDHGMLYAARRSHTITHRMESVTHALVHTNFASAQLADEMDDDFDEPAKLRIDDGSDGSSDTWPVIGELRNSVDRSSALKRSANRNCYQDLSLHSRKVSVNHVAQESKLNNFTQIVSEQDFYLLANTSFYDKRDPSGRKADIDAAQWKRTENGYAASNNPEHGALGDPAKKEVKNGNTAAALPCSDCRRLNCDCDSSVSAAQDNHPPATESSEEAYEIPPDLDNQDLQTLMRHLNPQEHRLFTDLVDTVINFSIQDLLREEMDEGHRPMEPSPEGLDLMTNTWEDVFQNPYDYMLHAMDSCPNCGRQITLSRMAPHIVNRCGESRSVEERAKRQGGRKNGLASFRTTRSTAKDSADAALYASTQPSSSSSTPLDDQDDTPDVEILADIPAPLPIPSVSSVYKRIGFPAGSRIASISEKLLRSKRQTSLSPEINAQKKVKLKKGENIDLDFEAIDDEY